ncbi:MAG: adenosylcobinamide-GDP ribazoletransferase [Candidatus Eremiobacteraeota bacterium]|nr:adenosylcobinamide-GDP ribazoletransferase [Candidatus Eremiobacteraeota bacterium]
MKRTLAGFLSALGYFTIIPAGAASVEAAPDAYAISFLPLIGMLVGGIAGALAWVVSFVAPHALVTCTAFALPILLTGAIHVDGFLDSCDGLFVTASAERRLEIFKDPRHGTFALAGMVILCSVWLSALWDFAGWQFPIVLAFAGGVGRLATVPNAFFIPYARGGAVTRQFQSRPSIAVLVVAAVLLLALSVYVGPWAWAIAIVAPLLNPWFARRLARRLDGGLVGDVYGYLIVVTEVLVLASLAAFRHA